MNIIIIEDESRAANRLEKILLEIVPNLNVLAKIETVEESISFLETADNLDLIFSDIQLADGLCFEIYEKVAVKCPIIFTTAFDKYAIKAFKTNGIDYLLKPIDEVELKKALEKAKSLSQSSDSSGKAALDEIMLLANALKSQNKSYKSRFMVKVGDKINSIAIEDIQAFYSLEKATFILTNEGRKYIVDYSLEHMETLLDNKLFFRINRKYIIPIKACKNIISYSNSRLRVQLNTLKDETIIVSRERVQDFKRWLDE